MYIWGKRKDRNQCPAVAAETPHLCCRDRKERLRWTKNVRHPRAENSSESARIWGKGWFPSPKQFFGYIIG